MCLPCFQNTYPEDAQACVEDVECRAVSGARVGRCMLHYCGYLFSVHLSFIGEIAESCFVLTSKARFKTAVAALSSLAFDCKVKSCSVCHRCRDTAAEAGFTLYLNYFCLFICITSHKSALLDWSPKCGISVLLHPICG